MTLDKFGNHLHGTMTLDRFGKHLHYHSMRKHYRRPELLKKEIEDFMQSVEKSTKRYSVLSLCGMENVTKDNIYFLINGVTTYDNVFYVGKIVKVNTNGNARLYINNDPYISIKHDQLREGDVLTVRVARTGIPPTSFLIEILLEIDESNVNN